MDQNQPVQTPVKKDSLFDSPVSASIIIGALIVAGSVIVGAYMIKGAPVTGGTVAQQQGTAPTTGVKISDRADEPVIGSKSAPVTVYEFGDFQCPFCKQFYQQSYADIKTKYIDTGKIKLVFRHYPLSAIHVNAEISSEAAECANRQGQFEAYYNTLYTKGNGDGTGLDSASLKAYASQLGLNMTTFNQCLDNHETKAVVAADLAVGTSAGVSGTPTFYINGTQVVGAQPTAAFEAAIDSALGK
jgi:protein-disulfide isomerase